MTQNHFGVMWTQWHNEGKGGGVVPSAAGKGTQNSLMVTEDILKLTTTEVSLTVC